MLVSKVNILGEKNHSNIFKDYYKIFLVMEYFQGGDIATSSGPVARKANTFPKT
jgi:hypothetical protein